MGVVIVQAKCKLNNTELLKLDLSEQANQMGALAVRWDSWLGNLSTDDGDAMDDA